MTDKSTEKELQELRAQVAELSRTRKAEESEQQAETETKSTPEHHGGDAPETAATDVLTAEGNTEEDVSSHLQELIETLEEEIKDNNPLTMLVIFALGILIGRLLPR